MFMNTEKRYGASCAVACRVCFHLIYDDLSLGVPNRVYLVD